MYQNEMQLSQIVRFHFDLTLGRAKSREKGLVRGKKKTDETNSNCKGEGRKKTLGKKGIGNVVGAYRHVTSCGPSN